MATSTNYGQVVITQYYRTLVPRAMRYGRIAMLWVSVEAPPPYSMSYTKEVICDPVMATQFPRVITSTDYGMVPRHNIQTTGCPIPWFFTWRPLAQCRRIP